MHTLLMIINKPMLSKGRVTKNSVALFFLLNMLLAPMQMRELKELIQNPTRKTAALPQTVLGLRIMLKCLDKVVA